MYIPNHFKNENIEEVKDFINKNSFGILINQENGKISGTHIPLELDTDKNGKNILVGHISKVNPQWKGFENTEEVLAIFQGPQSYVSSSWYNFESVPTWNYIAVHVYGKIEIIEGVELLKVMKKLVDKYEKNSKNPVSIEKLSSKTMKIINGIVGFKISITEIQAAHKLSQNKDETNRKNIIKELEKSNDFSAIEIAKEMKK